MRQKLLKDISANTLQVTINQALGLLIFILTSRYLSKAVYGELNWSLAILTFITTILSLRLEQIVVRKVAAGDDPSKMLTLFFGHTVFSGLLFYAALLAGSLLFPSFFAQHSLLLILAISQLLSFFSSPFKQLANGKEKFGWLAVMSSVSNLVRSVWLLWVVLYSSLTVQQVLFAFIASSLAELLVCWLVMARLRINLSSRWRLQDYFMLIRESLPQIGVVFLNASIARMDWILLGFFSTPVKTAEYSFAYKIFELSPVPLLILGPILLSRFSVYFGTQRERSLAHRKTELSLLVRMEMVVATLFPLVLNVVWTPLADLVTHHKYGAVNATTFLVLSFCIPFQYMSNLFWTMHFSQGHLKLIFRITAVTCVVIVAGDFVMIPLFNTMGAALVYLLAMVVEYILYLRVSLLAGMQKSYASLVLCIAAACIGGFAGHSLLIPLVFQVVISVVVYAVLLIVTGQIRKNDLGLLKYWLFKRGIIHPA